MYLIFNSIQLEVFWLLYTVVVHWQHGWKLHFNAGTHTMCMAILFVVCTLQLSYLSYIHSTLLHSYPPATQFWAVSPCAHLSSIVLSSKLYYSVVFIFWAIKEGGGKGLPPYIPRSRGVGVEGILCLLLNSGREIMRTYKCKNPLEV